MVKNQYVTNDRRVFERLTFHYPVKINCRKDQCRIKAISNNISASGIKFNLKKKLNSKDEISISFEMPDGTVILIFHGKVVWTKSTGEDLDDVGVEFNSVLFLKLQHLLDLVLPSEEPPNISLA